MREKQIHAAGQINKTFKPYFYQSYKSPEQVQACFPALPFTYETPAFMKETEEFTTQEEMMNFLYNLLEKTEQMQLEIIGKTLEGREIPMVIFSAVLDEEERKEKPTVWLQANVHGHEPASGESALVIINELATGELGKEILPDVNVVVVPRINPDSVYYHEQKSPLQINGNRDHVQLEMPELMALHQAFNRFEAEVVIDAHEYDGDLAYPYAGKSGALKYHDLLILSGKNLNIPAEIRQQSDELFLPEVFSALDEEGISNGTYFTIEHNESKEIIAREGGDDAGIGRNAFALKPSICFLTESRGINIGRENFLRRVASQVITHRAILRTTKKHASKIKQLIANAKLEIIDRAGQGKGNKDIILTSEPIEIEEMTVRAIDETTGGVVELPVTYYDQTNAMPKRKRQLPNAYILPAAYHWLAEKLVIHGAGINKTEEAANLEVECYVNEVAKLELVEKEIHFPEGSYIIHTDQCAGNIIALALEPESAYSFFAQGYFHQTLGEEIPIYRYFGEMHL